MKFSQGNFAKVSFQVHYDTFWFDFVWKWGVMSLIESIRTRQRKTIYVLQILKKGLEMYCSRALREEGVNIFETDALVVY